MSATALSRQVVATTLQIGAWFPDFEIVPEKILDALADDRLQTVERLVHKQIWNDLHLREQKSLEESARILWRRSSLATRFGRCMSISGCADWLKKDGDLRRPFCAHQDSVLLRFEEVCRNATLALQQGLQKVGYAAPSAEVHLDQDFYRESAWDWRATVTAMPWIGLQDLKRDYPDQDLVFDLDPKSEDLLRSDLSRAFGVELAGLAQQVNQSMMWRVFQPRRESILLAIDFLLKQNVLFDKKAEVLLLDLRKSVVGCTGSFLECAVNARNLLNHVSEVSP